MEKDLELVTTEELIEELMKRFKNGILLFETEHNEKYNREFSKIWGNSIWAIGAAKVLARRTNQMNIANFHPREDPND